MYRHLVSIDGNTAAWDRPAWIMASNSVLWKQESDHVCWWSDLCLEGKHYVGFKEPEDIKISGINFKKIVENSHVFVKEHLSEEAHVARWKEVLSNC
jgi:hypothetical protein